MQKRTLADLHIDESGTVMQIEGGGEGLRRLLDLGFVAGTKITALFSSPSGDPTAYFVRGTVIAIRGADAKKIILRTDQ